MTVSVLPAAAAALSEPTSVDLAARVRVTAIKTPLTGHPIPTAFVAAREKAGMVPLLFIHGFDSSLFEFRRLLPLLEPHGPAWAVDLLGFGFSDRTLIAKLSPEAIKLHLHSFWQQMIGTPMVLVGASMGGAAAIDFALTYPATVAGLVLIDAAGFAAGPALGNLMVPPLDSWATAFLRNPWVRRSISRQAYFDKTLVTPDAELCAALHLQCPGWKDALIAFTKSGGYNFLAPKIPQIPCPTLVVWGEQDNILGTKDARRFEGAIATSQLIWLPQCGHVPHLEKPQETAAAILPFVERLAQPTSPSLPKLG